MRTSFNHQPEAQHPNLRLFTNRRPITLSIWSLTEEERTQSG